MSLILRAEISDAHPKTIICIAYNAHRREMYLGGEDGSITVWDSDTQKQLNTFSGHNGWITSLIYCKEIRMLISASLDGFMHIWATNGKIVQTINMGSPIYGIFYNTKRFQIMVAMNKKVKLLYVKNIEDIKMSGSISATSFFHKHTNTVQQHTDIISCLCCLDGKFISAGYDKRIVIYDLSHSTDAALSTARIVENAHDAAITCMTTGKDYDNTWFVTGSHDCAVKLWSTDGALLRKFEGFLSHISSICYIEPTQALWVTANSTKPVILDPRSGIDISEFVEYPSHTSIVKPLSADIPPSELSSIIQQPYFKIFWYNCDTEEVVGITNRRIAKIWNFDRFSALSVLRGHSDGPECITHSSNGPILIFTCGEDSIIRKWERLQLNTSLYSQELIHIPTRTVTVELTEQQLREKAIKNIRKDVRQVKKDELKKKNLIKNNHYLAKLKEFKSLGPANGGNGNDDKMNLTRQIELLSAETQKVFKRSLTLIATVPSTAAEREAKEAEQELKRLENFDDPYGYIKKHSIARMFYHEELEFLICASNDSHIYILGYDGGDFDIPVKLSQFSKTDSVEIPDKKKKSDLVAGILLQHTFSQHKGAVTCFTCILFNGVNYMLSSGWDRRLCLWNLDTAEFIGTYKNGIKENGFTFDEYVADGVVTDLTYCPERKEFAYSSADKLVYIRKFSPVVQEMTLSITLQGHKADVIIVDWSSKLQNWITAAEDQCIRFWSGDGLQCVRTLNNEAHITCILLDDERNCLITGSSDTFIRAFDLERKDKFPCNVYRGHKDEVRGLILIKERKQYVSISKDNTVRIWNAFKYDKQMKEADQAYELEKLEIQESKKANDKDHIETEDELKTIMEVKNKQFDKELQEAVNDLEKYLFK